MGLKPPSDAHVVADGVGDGTADERRQDEATLRLEGTAWQLRPFSAALCDFSHGRHLATWVVQPVDDGLGACRSILADELLDPHRLTHPGGLLVEAMLEPRAHKVLLVGCAG